MGSPAMPSASSLSSHFSSSFHCQDRPLLHLSSLTSTSRRACGWARPPGRSSMEVGQAISSSSLVSESPSPSTSGIAWAQVALQGPRPEMEDSIVIRSDGLQGFSYAAVLDGHAGFSSVSFLREELYNECVTATENGSLLLTSDLSRIKTVLAQAFLQADRRLLSWLEETGEDLESGSTATIIFLGADRLIVAHVGDSKAVIARSGKADVLCSDHRPYGKSKTALEETKRVKRAGGWISNGRVCGYLSVSRAFGDIKLKTLRQEMLEEGVKTGLWTRKFASRVELNGEWVTATPDVIQTAVEDTDFIILATDGLWDYIQSSEAVRFVRNQLQQHGDIQLACDALANLALNKNGQDNVSIVIADLGRVEYNPNAPIEEGNFGAEAGQLVVVLGLVGLGIWLSQFMIHTRLF